MPDQPDDPIHYDMKVPPEPQNAPLNKQREEQRGSDEVTAESNEMHDKSAGNANPQPRLRAGQRASRVAIDGDISRQMTSPAIARASDATARSAAITRRRFMSETYKPPATVALSP